MLLWAECIVLITALPFLSLQVHSASGYHLGPMGKHIPKFSADPVYKKKFVGQLSKFLERMNQEWKESEEKREKHTKARCARNQHELFEYTDVDSGEQIPPRVYQERFMQYVKAHEVDPIIRLLPVSAAAASGDPDIADAPSTLKEKPASGAVKRAKLPVAANRVGGQRNEISALCSVLGIDISKSCIMDDGFFKNYKPNIDGRVLILVWAMALLRNRE